MKVKERIDKFTELFENHHHKELLENLRKGNNFLVIDFSNIIKHDPDLASDILDCPEETIECAEAAVENFKKDVKNFKIRISNLSKHTTKQINQLRKKDLDKLITVSGSIKQKSNVRPLIVSVKYECPACANTMVILQTTEILSQPSKCGCGRKGKFKQISSEKIDVYSLQVEELIDEVEGVSKLAKLKMLCKNDLTRTELERKLHIGAKVEVTGILKEMKVRKKEGSISTLLDWYLEVNYIDVSDETFGLLKLSKKDKQDIEAFVKKGNVFNRLGEIIFSNIHGLTVEKKGVIIYMFGGVSFSYGGSKTDRGEIHVLLIGDGGLAKSTILKRVKSYVPKGVYIAGKGVSAAGLMGAVVKDELMGGYVLEAGAFSLANDGYLCIDEMDKIGDEFRDAVHQPMEDREISISKAGVQQTVPARTAVLAAANPRGGGFSPCDAICKQIDMPDTLLSRFDLIYPIRRDRLTKEDFYKISKEMNSRKQEKTPEEIKQEERDVLFVKKYISYAKSFNPTMSDKLGDILANWFADTCERSKGSHQNQIPITPRAQQAVRRISEGIARMYLRDKITERDLNQAIEIVMHSLEQIALDPLTGDVVTEYLYVGTNKKLDLATRILVLIRELSGNEKPVPADEILSVLDEEGHKDPLLIEKAIEKLKSNGNIFEPETGSYKELK